MSKDFSQILSDFKPIFDNCREGTYGKDAENFQGNANVINSVLSSWIFYLTKSADQKYSNGLLLNFANADCSPDKNFQNFDLINPTSISAIEELKNANNSYLLTSLILTDLSVDKSEKELYNTLKKVVNENFSSQEKVSVLNNPRTASLVLLALNALASAHYNNLLKKFYKRATENAENMSQVDKDLAKNLTDQIGGAKAGKVVRKPQTGGKRHRSHVIPASFRKGKY